MWNQLSCGRFEIGMDVVELDFAIIRKAEGIFRPNPGSQRLRLGLSLCLSFYYFPFGDISPFDLRFLILSSFLCSNLALLPFWEINGRK